MILAASLDELGGILGFVTALMSAIGEWGVGLATLIETIFPPIPSEIILPLAGFLASQGEMSVPLVLLASTAGAYVGALVLYALGSALGMERSIRMLSKLPLVDRDDFEKAAGWFIRHGRSAIFFGRLIPGVRSLISLPAGAARMPLGVFTVFTVAGSGLWNSLLVLLGVALGSQYELIDKYSQYLDYAVYLAIAVVLGVLVIRASRRRLRRGRSGRPREATESR